MATRAVPKKVRLACRRCRSRRIKCDGQTPACSNCAKAGEPCLDVDSQNSHLLIPRNFASAARARIQWLEDIIRTRLPDVDLTSGPQIDGAPDVPRSPEATLREPGEVAGPTVTPSPDALTHHRMSLKRPADDTEPFSEKAHSVAMNLGLLSLNSDSSQKAYLGSSSGLLFANLVCASPSSNPSSTIATQDPADGPAHDLLDRQVSMQSHYRALHYVLRQELPKYEDAALLLQTYIRWIHPEYPILDPASLYGALAALYSCSSYDLNDEPLIPGGWPSGLEPFSWNGKVVQPSHRGSECPPVPVLAFILFMIFNIAAIIKVRSRVYEYSPERYYRLATRFSGDCFSQISLSSVQALTLLIVHCLHTPAEPSFWTLIHVGMAHCVELGLHREPQPGGPDSPTVQQVKRLVFYTLYGLDRSISSIQGRPIGFRDESFDINPPKAEAGPSGITHTPGIPSPITDSFRYTVLRFELDQIVSDIKMRLYLLPSKTAEADAGDAIASQETIHHTLTKWNDRMNAHWSGHAAPSEGRQKYLWGLKLQIRYHTTMILLFQPSQRIPNPSQDSLRIVYNSASVILRSYDLLHKNHALHHGWRSVQNIFAAGAALVYSFWTAELVRSRASPTELSRSLRSCSSLLSVGGEWWPSVKTSLVSFGSVVDLTIQKLYTRSPAAKQARLAMSPSTRDVVPEQGVAAGDNEPGSIPPESSDAPDPATWTHFGHVQQVAGSGTGQPREQWMSPMGEGELQTPTQHWRGGLAYTSTAQEMHSPQERMPEIEDFLADFGRSDFSWSFPLGEIEEALDPDAFLDP